MRFERTRAVPRIVDALRLTDATEALRSVVLLIEEQLEDPALDVRAKARLIRALFLAGESQRALELSEELVASAPDLGAPTDLASLVGSLRADVSVPARSGNVRGPCEIEMSGQEILAIYGLRRA